MLLTLRNLLVAIFLTSSLSEAAKSQNASYAPTYVKCPSNLTVRAASEGLSSEEQAWRTLRLTEVVKSLSTYLQTANISGFNATEYMSKVNASNAPVAGMAISGGGSQSGMGGLGIWQAFDARYAPAVTAGTGGLVQCLAYLTGLSGGGFNTVLPLASNNFSSLADLRAAVDLTTNYVTGPSGNANKFFKKIFYLTASKLEKGFPISVTDIFGQFFRQYLPASWAFKDVSDIAGPGEGFSQGLTPMPIVLFTEVIPGSSPEIHKIAYPNASQSTIYEETPFEFGSWLGGRVQAFLPTKYLGTTMNKGKPKKSNQCVNGFDKVTFAQGSTGNAFNFWFIDDFYGIPLFEKRNVHPPKRAENNTLAQLVDGVAQNFNQTFNASMWATYPNPFENYNKAMSGVDELLLVDGSETGETVPIRPLIVPERKVDYIVVFDSDTEEPGNNWVNGTTFGQSYIAAQRLNLSFPEIPDAATFVNYGLNKYPTFFGCNATNSSTPLVLYLPNAPWSAYTNYSYATPEFTNNQLDLVFNNSFNIATYGQGGIIQQSNHTRHGNHTAQTYLTTASSQPSWSSCVACGLIYKSLLRTNQSVPETCQMCFSLHCWNGTTADSPAAPAYEPELLLDPGISYHKWNKTVWM